ncbi:MAG: hypothetical protein HY882_16770 [Deltaproteobacteria bacterium]|nr:hypothetical protein [Deltaproteobacteria bacterium]
MEWVDEPARRTAVLARVDLLVCWGGFAGVAAALALRQRKLPGELDVAQLQRELQAQGMGLGLSARKN